MDVTGARRDSDAEAAVTVGRQDTGYQVREEMERYTCATEAGRLGRARRPHADRRRRWV